MVHIETKMQQSRSKCGDSQKKERSKCGLNTNLDSISTQWFLNQSYANCQQEY